MRQGSNQDLRSDPFPRAAAQPEFSHFGKAFAVTCQGVLSYGIPDHPGSLAKFPCNVQH